MKRHIFCIILFIMVTGCVGRAPIRNYPSPEDIPITERDRVFRSVDPRQKRSLWNHTKTYWYGEPDYIPTWRMRFRAPENYYDGGKNWFQRWFDKFKGRPDEFWETEDQKIRRWEEYRRNN